MGIAYSFNFITPRDNVLKLLTSFAKGLAREDREFLGTLDTYQPELEKVIIDNWEIQHPVKMGIKHYRERKRCKSSNYYCVSFLPEIDTHIQSFFDTHHAPQLENGRYPIGCVYISLFAGVDSVLLTAQAATSGMSRLFENSGNIQKLCCDIAKEAGKTTLFFDKEDDLYWRRMYPGKKRLVKPDIDLFICTSELLLNVDAYILEVDRLSGRELLK